MRGWEVTFLGSVLLLLGQAQGQVRNLELNEFVGQVVISLDKHLSWSSLTLTTPSSPNTRFYLQLLRNKGRTLGGPITINGVSYSKYSELERFLDPKDDNSSEEDSSQNGLLPGSLTLTLEPSQWGKDEARVTFLLTLLGQGQGVPGNWFNCTPSGGETFLLPPYLECNGVVNCPWGGDEDGCGRGCDPDKDGDEEDDRWYEVQYLLTILLAGLFFILSPICIVIFLFYHRRMSAAAAARVARQGRPYPREQDHYVTDSPANDIPPSYDDLHELKTPPPPFHATIRVTSTPNQRSTQEEA